MITKLILFDIDHTLIDPGRAGIKALDLVFAEKYELQNVMAQVAADGRTDRQILGEIARQFGLNIAEDDRRDINRRYLKHLKVTVDNPAGQVLPGVSLLLDRLTTAPNYLVGLLTGNVEVGAQIKLQHYDLDRYFSLGAYGSDHEDRNKLLPVAVQKAEQVCGRKFTYSQCVVIGDTPLDVQCAKPYGAVAVGVATGRYSLAELQAAGADYTVADLRQTPFLSRLTPHGRPDPNLL